MCCRHGDRGTCGMWSTRTWSSSACGAGFHRRWPGVSSGICSTWSKKPCRGCCRWRPGNVRGGVVPRPANEGGRTAWHGLHGGGLLCGSCRRAAGRVHLRTCGRCESVAGVAGTGVRSVGIHDDVGVVGGPDEKLHEELVWPAVVASRLVQACNLVVLVDGSHAPETRGKVRVPGGRTFMQNCVKRSRGLTYLE